MTIKDFIKYFPRRYRDFMRKGDVSLSQMRYMNSKNALINSTLHSIESGISTTQYIKGHQLVVSLTTYDKRLQEVFISIESIMQQTMKPNRIILWLSNDFKDTVLPLTLQKQVKRGLEIKYCKDIRSYKKLIPTLRLCPNDVVITIDDDVIYRFDMVENLVNAYIEDPHYIYCNRMHRMRIDNQNKTILPYSDWEWDIKDTNVTTLNFPTGCGGILYPPLSLAKEVLDENVFMNICPLADDVWFKAMALLNNYQDRKVETQEDTYLLSEENQDIALSNFNVGQNANDTQIMGVFDKYQLYDKLIE